MRTFWLVLYYAFARHLPKSTMPVLGKPALRLRYRCAKHLFAECGTNVNVEQGAYFGNGKNIRVGNHVGIGKDFCTHNRPLLVRDRLLMAENVLFLGGGAYLRKPQCTNWYRTGDESANTVGDSRRCLDRCKGDYFARLQAHWCT